MWIKILVIGVSIGVCVCRVSAADESASTEIRVVVKKSLKLLQSSQAVYSEKRACYSCHHQSLTTMAVSLAGRHGFDIDKELLEAQAKVTLKFFARRIDKMKQGENMPGGPYTPAYALVGLAEIKQSSDETTNAMVSYLLKTQKKDGRWKMPTHRPPLEHSDFTSTSLSIRALRKFASESQGKEIDRRVIRARDWLIEAKTKETEDKVFRLFGLKWAGASDKHIQGAVKALLADQRDDGGWSQLPNKNADQNTDAYATGQALVALGGAGGVGSDHQAYRKGIAWLMKHRKPDGSWRVKTRSKPIQRYFESGFPHGKDQFISICATSWSTMALVLACEAESKLGPDPKPESKSDPKSDPKSKPKSGPKSGRDD